MFLTQAELIEMTGYQKHQAQQRWLKAQRIPFLIGGDGMPRVMRATVLGIMGVCFKSLFLLAALSNCLAPV